MHYVWQTLSFDAQGLQTTDGQELAILAPGKLNTNQGPDFGEAHILLGGLDWYGAIELHTTTDHWYRHGHHQDTAYNSTILHVVLHSTGRPVQRADGTCIPELELGPRIRQQLLSYEHLMLAQSFIPCSGQVARVPGLIQAGWLARMGWERLQQKADALRPWLAQAQGDWEQLLWMVLCRALGSPQNQQPFEQLSMAMPISLVKRYRTDLFQLEALLLGAAGMLAHHPDDAYMARLHTEWQFLRQKHRLPPGPPLHWQMHRMRPSHFPSLRLAQLAALLHRLPNLFPLIEDAACLHTPIVASGYWDTHYRLGEASTAEQPKPKVLGTATLHSLQINALIPFRILYDQQTGKPEQVEAAQSLLEAIPRENNHITTAMAAEGFAHRNAFDSQALYHLYTCYCTEKKCTHCAIGHRLLRG
jgi:hypothetical protein